MRRPYLLAAVALSAMAVLAFEAADLRSERARLLDDFAQTHQGMLRQVGADLDKAFRDIDEDARLVADLVRQPAVQAAVRDTRDRTILSSAFQALVTVVRHYRLVGLLGPGGPVVVAPDRSEGPTAVESFRRWSEQAAIHARQAGRPVLAGPFDLTDGRQFQLYAAPQSNGEVVVLVWEEGLFLSTVLRPRPPTLRYFVIDPARTMWINCASAETCRGLPERQWSAIEGLRALAQRLAPEAGLEWGADAGAAALGLPEHAALATWMRVTGPDGRPWTLGRVVSATSLEAREKSLLLRLLMVSATLLVAMSALAAVLIGHLRRTAVQGERLRSAHEVAHLRERSEKIVASLEQQLVRAEKLVTTGVLTAGLAHEIGTPLTIIRARAESLLERVSDAGHRRDLESVVAQIDHISATIRQVLDFSRTQPVELRATDVREALAGVQSLLEWRFRQKSLRVRVEGPPDLRHVAADPDQLQQVLVNLLMNAADASEKGETIVVRLSNEGDGLVRVEIADTGCGIPPEDINAVFDPFFTTKKRGEGTGLGLPVVASIVRNHHGEVTLNSDVGVGTTVVVSWPAMRGRVEAPAEAVR